MKVQHQRSPAGPPNTWDRFFTPTIVGVVAASGWIIADIAMGQWWLIPLGVLIGVSLWGATWFYAGAYYNRGKAEVYLKQAAAIWRDIERKLGRWPSS